MEICQYLRLHMNITCWRFRIKTPFTFRDLRKWDMWKVYLQTLRNNWICWKFAYFLRNLQTSRANNSRILSIKNAKFSGYCFYMSTNIYGNFEICISVPLTFSSMKSFKMNQLTCGVYFFFIWLVERTQLREEPIW